MSVTRREMDCTSQQVFEVLSDGWLLGLWVVGASRIRDVDLTWPVIGATVHHSVGSWPLLLNDTTSVTAIDRGRFLALRARAWPAGEADVQITVEPLAGGCRVSIAEDVAAGPGRLVPKILLNLILHWRNVESLRRLAYLAERRTTTTTPTTT